MVFRRDAFKKCDAARAGGTTELAAGQDPAPIRAKF